MLQQGATDAVSPILLIFACYAKFGFMKSLHTGLAWASTYWNRIGLMFLLSCVICFQAGCEPPKPVDPAPPPAPEVPAPPRLAPHDASRQGEIDQLQRHIELGIDIDLRDEYGATLLHEAASTGQEAVVRWLIERGADLEAVDESGFTPIQLASFMDHDRIVDLLLEYGAVPVAYEEVDFEELPEPEIEEPVDVVDVPKPELPEEWKDLEFLTWTSSAGQEVEAVFLEMQQDLVILGSREGQISRVPINQLARDDQIRARELAMGNLAAMRARPGRAALDPGITRVTAGFSSDCERLLLRGIQQAREEVLVAIYTLTRPQIEQALSRAAGRGVKVHVKYDHGQIETGRMQELITRLESRGVEITPISMSGRFASMHHKFAVIDRTQVFTGSFNFTVTAVTQSYENCVMIESSVVARDFIREFDQIRSR